MAMGLDTYAVYGRDHNKYVKGGDNNIPDELFPDNRLCGGMFSGGGNSFRGKVYADYVEWVTDVSLYEEIIDADLVKVMAEQLSAVTEDKFNEFDNEWGITYDEAKDLAKWFSVVADEGGSVVGWW
jgi:hypothetical protein